MAGMATFTGPVLVRFRHTDPTKPPTQYDEVTILESGALKTVGPFVGESPLVGKYTYGSQVLIHQPGSWTGIEVVQQNQEPIGSLFVIDAPSPNHYHYDQPTVTEQLHNAGKQRMTKEQAVAIAESYIKDKWYDTGGMHVEHDMFKANPDLPVPTVTRHAHIGGEDCVLHRQLRFVWLSTPSGKGPKVDWSI